MAEQKAGGWTTRYKFTGKEMDETGLYYYGARYYDPILGVFFGIDELTEDGPEWNGYQYAFNNPIKFIDPDGNWPEWPDVHTVLDVAGMVPGLGEVADGLNAVIYLAEGDYTNAAMSAAAMVPGAGTAVAVAKLAKKVDKATSVTKTATKTTKSVTPPKKTPSTPPSKTPAKPSGNGMKNKAQIKEGKDFEVEQVNKLKAKGENVSSQTRLVPQNGKGNVKGNRTNADALVKNNDGTFDVIEYKRTKNTQQSAGQKASQKNVTNGNKQFEVRSDVPSQGLKKGDIIQVRNYDKVSKYN